MAAKSHRRENLQFLVYCYGSQTAVADKIHPSTPTQPMISQILGNSRRRRFFHDFEVKTIERKIGIPEGWMDKYPLRKAWRIVKQFQGLSPDARNAVNSMLQFADENSQNIRSSAASDLCN